MKIYMHYISESFKKEIETKVLEGQRFPNGSIRAGSYIIGENHLNKLYFTEKVKDCGYSMFSTSPSTENFIKELKEHFEDGLEEINEYYKALNDSREMFECYGAVVKENFDAMFKTCEDIRENIELKFKLCSHLNKEESSTEENTAPNIRVVVKIASDNPDPAELIAVVHTADKCPNCKGNAFNIFKSKTCKNIKVSCASCNSVVKTNESFQRAFNTIFSD